LLEGVEVVYEGYGGVEVLIVVLGYQGEVMFVARGGRGKIDA
jgi:hypothetical protein